MKQAVSHLKNGGVVGIPTETVYGLGAAITEEKGLKAIFTLKERPFFDPLIVHIGHKEMIKMVVSDWPPLAEFLANYFWPGPLTLILPKNENISPIITSGLTTVGIRFPSHPIAQELICQLGIPVAAPSANKFGKTSPTSAQHVKEEFPDLLVLDGGPSTAGIESTIIEISSERRSTLRILRPGPIGINRIREVMAMAPEEMRKDVVIEVAPHDPKAPGHLKHHYQPKIPLVVVEESDLLHNKTDLCQFLQQKYAFAGIRGEELILEEDPCMAARFLYERMRFLSASADFIYVIHKTEHQGDEWMAIWNRLDRAKSF